MATLSSEPNSFPSSDTPRGTGRPRRSRRGGRYQHFPPRASNQSTSTITSAIHATAAPEATPESSQSRTQAAAGPSSRGRAGRSGRGGNTGRRGVASRAVVGGQRAFGGQLSTIDGNAPNASARALNADAQEFKPGQSISTSHITSRPQQRRLSKSSAPDIATRTHEDIDHGLYECPICTNEIFRNSRVWSCKTCWTVFHLSCVKKWSRNEGSGQQRQQDESGEFPTPRQWRCPGCNLPKEELPSSYTCWCGKEVDPKSITGLPPHSCGQTCSKPRAPRKCPHPCELICHAGPCPPCPHMGPALACYCGKSISTKRCIDTNYDSGWSCEEICGDLMPCGEHTCSRPCHEGLCGDCEVMVDSRCYCGKMSKTVRCSETGEPRESMSLPPSTEGEDGETVLGQSQEEWTGSFDCRTLCGRPFDCGKHACQKTCHEYSTVDPIHCPFSPDVVTHCPCGKTTLAELDCTRNSCEDKIPHCEEICHRQLPCGHLCEQKCHTGQCMPCLQRVTIKCRCGRTSSSTICHQGMEEAPQCARTCKAVLNCGRHECGERCCPVDEEIEAVHICTRTCGRVLKCGNPEHTCQQLCHRGPCGNCQEAIFDEIACHCGRTVLQPPQPCGTQPPPCQFQCTRPTHCGHPQVSHHCHMEDTCPKCPYLVEKSCMCGKKVLKNQPCWLEQVSCGQPCARRLRCGIHFCRKTCHRAGDCEDADSKPCLHQCGKKKTAANCRHPCLDTCHAPYPCKEDRPCQAKIIITCPCQRRKQEVRCLATKVGDQKLEDRELKCDDECLRLQRNQKLAAALNIDSNHMDDHVPYSTATLNMFKEDVKWAQMQEREVRIFAADEEAKRLRFKPMQPRQRAFLHSLAEDFGLDSESLDPEPHRHVILYKTPRFVSEPLKTISQCINIKPTIQAPTGVTATPAPPSTQEFNAILLMNPKFALTIEELREALHADILAGCQISFLPSEEVVLHASHDTKHLDQTTLKNLKPQILKTVSALSLASDVILCRIDESLNVIRREESQAAGGWSQVVKGPLAKVRIKAENSVGSRSAFTVLGSKAPSTRKVAKDTEPVIDDWELAAE